MDLRRLFDCIPYSLETGGIPNMLCSKEGGQWKKYSTQDVKEIMDRTSAGLILKEISAGDHTSEGRDKVAIISRNRPEWLMVDLAVQQIGAVLIPIYPTINLNELEFILNDAKVKLAFAGDEETWKKLESVKAQVPSLKEIFTFEKLPGANHWTEMQSALTPDLAARIENISGSIKYEDLATIIYTSGTTGTPKGVMLSHENILSNVMASIPCFPPGNEMRALSFLPLNHIFERMVSYLYLFRGTAIYYAENLATIGDNLKEVKPHIFTTVPYLLEKVYEKIMQKGAEKKGIVRKLFFWAHGLAEKFEINTNQGAWYNFQLDLANKIVFSKWREALGNNLTCIVSGGAACQPRLITIFTAARIPVMEGYGLTETSPVISVNRFEEKDRKIGTVGPLLDKVQVKIAEDGEILCKGPNIMMGYYKKPELTNEVITDGWFHTGDIGCMIEERFLKILDRKKELFKTSGGKYVAPLAIETKLKESMFIEQVMVVGADRKFVGALLVPSFANLREWCRQHQITPGSDEEMIQLPAVFNLFKQVVDEFNTGFSHVEQVKRFSILPRVWTVEQGELTPKLSLKRKVIAEKYGQYIDKLYTA